MKNLLFVITSILLLSACNDYDYEAEAKIHHETFIKNDTIVLKDCVVYSDTIADLFGPLRVITNAEATSWQEFNVGGDTVVLTSNDGGKTYTMKTKHKPKMKTALVEKPWGLSVLYPEWKPAPYKIVPDSFWQLPKSQGSFIDTNWFKNPDFRALQKLYKDSSPILVDSFPNLHRCEIAISSGFDKACLEKDSLRITGDTAKLLKFAMQLLIEANNRYIKLDTTFHKYAIPNQF